MRLCSWVKWAPTLENNMCFVDVREYLCSIYHLNIPFYHVYSRSDPGIVLDIVAKLYESPWQVTLTCSCLVLLSVNTHKFVYVNLSYVHSLLPVHPGNTECRHAACTTASFFFFFFCFCFFFVFFLWSLLCLSISGWPAGFGGYSPQPGTIVCTITKEGLSYSTTMTAL